MPPTIDHGVSWEAEHGLVPQPAGFDPQDSIATESQMLESPEWAKCIDALLEQLHAVGADGDDGPNHTAIQAALHWLVDLRRAFPWAPPTVIAPEPSGGVIVERRVQTNGQDSLCELTFYNDGKAERTDYFNGRVVHIQEIPLKKSA